ncbi:uncharacterized protein LOC119371112, partial [Jatropha curcas]|uniref:uncharacterized protein LOC119371112 n=1 Tax=Jatropha curcas TaxID=180498 RepID=UPI0018963897
LLNFSQFQRSGSCVWTKLPHGFIKCNVDAAMNNITDIVRAGWMVRAEEGFFINAFQTTFPGAQDSNVAEALSFHEALSWSKSNALHHVVFELDSLVLVQALKWKQPDALYFRSLDCRSLLNELLASSVVFVKRSVDIVALATFTYFV